jgi:VIT1/CCC1 family predicted Fe2+/Mn2+ transporter
MHDMHQVHHVASDAGLEPADRIAEILFGVIMVLTFTGSLSVAEAGQVEVQEMLRGALGCNVAWGIVDGFIFVMASVAERRRTYVVGKTIRESKDGASAIQSLKNWLPSEAVALLEPSAIENMSRKLQAAPQPPAPHLTWIDIRSAIAVFFLVFLSTLPVIAPFFFMTEIHRALRFSHTIALVMLAVLGAAYARTTGQKPLRGALLMAGFGVVLAAMTLALGG